MSILELASSLYGLEYGKTSYDDLIMITALVIAITAILLIIQLFKGFLHK